MHEPTLAGRTIALPETRELDVFAGLLERRGAHVLRCPLIAILDAPDPAPVLDWMRAFNDGACDDLILLTGEGLRRLLSCIQQYDPVLREPFVARLGQVRKITRGPKPARALRELGLRPDIAAEVPTTAGVIAALSNHELAGDLAGRNIGVQLYGTEPNLPLVHFLQGAGARALTVAPYIYADEAADETVLALLRRMSAGEIDAIAFTSAKQVDRLFAVAPVELVRSALMRTHVAAVGPVVADALSTRGIAVSSMPEASWFMKPLTSELADVLGARS